MSLDVDHILSSAEGIYHQIVSAPHLTDQIRVILGMPTVNNTTSNHSDASEDDDRPTTSKTLNTNGTCTNGEKSDSGSIFGDTTEEVMYQIGLDMNF